jgi:hypothetical protein
MTGVSLDIAVQPPAVIRRGAVLDPPLVLVTRANDSVNDHSEDLTQIWAFATLVDQDGEVVSGSLGGSLAESAHPFTSSDDSSGYFLFENLSIDSIGTYRLRVTLMRMHSGSGAATLQQVTTRLIVVADEDVQGQLPSMTLATVLCMNLADARHRCFRARIS